MTLMQYVGGPRCGDQTNVDPSKIRAVQVPVLRAGSTERYVGTYNVRADHSPRTEMERTILLWDEGSIKKRPS